MTTYVTPGMDLPGIAAQAAQAGGDLIQLAPGTHQWPEVNRHLLIRPGVTIVGAPNGASTIVLKGTHGQAIQTDGPGAYAGLRDVVVAYDVVPPPGSYAIINRYLSRFQLHDVRIRSAQNGILVGENSGYVDFSGLTIDSQGDGITFAAYSGESIGGGAIHRYRSQGVSGRGTAALRFTGPIGYDKLDVEFDLAEQHDYGVIVGGLVTGNLSYMTFRGTIDGTNGAGFRLDPSSGHIRAWKLLGITNQGHPNPGASFGLYCVLSNGAKVDGLIVADCSWADHDREAVILVGPPADFRQVRISGNTVLNCRTPAYVYPASADILVV